MFVILTNMLLLYYIKQYCNKYIILHYTPLPKFKIKDKNRKENIEK